MIGEVLGNYRIDSIVGEGGMGVVYAAEHVVIGRKVAVKLLQPRMSNDADLVGRFFAEARTTATIQHPGLVEVFDFGHHDDGRAYIVMELLDGESLKARLKAERPLPVDAALAIARQVASALHAAHEHGIVHRDLKPENIFLIVDRDAPMQVRVKVLDFGIAKLVHEEEQRSVKTKTGAVFGTPRYMSPEQCKNAANVDRRSDIYALGCILHEMVLGVPPFDYESWGELVAAHIHETPRPPREIDPELPPVLETIVLKMIARQPDDRYATMADVVQAIEGGWRDAVSRAYPIALSTPPTGHRAVTSRQGVAPTLPVAAEVSALNPPRRTRRWPVIAAAAGGLAIAVAIVIGARPSSSPRSAATSDDVPVAQGVTVTVDATTTIDAVAAIATDAGATTGSAKVHLVVESTPAGADVYRALDGVKLGKTPLARDFDRTDGEVELVLKRAGFRDAKVSLSTAQDGTSRTTLVRPAPPKHPAGSGSGPTVLDPYGDGR